MHWASYDKATWGIILAVAAIVLAFPLSLFANLATPKIRNWWAERSIASLKKWITALEGQLAEFENSTPLSEGEDAIIFSLRNTSLIIYLIANFALLAVYVIAAEKLKIIQWVMGGYLVGVFLLMKALDFMINPLDDVIRARSPSRKKQIARDIEKLKSKLSAKH